MPYELRLPGQAPQPFETEDAAIAAARAALQADPDAEPEVFDATTGTPAAPGASKAWREDLLKRVGF